MSEQNQVDNRQSVRVTSRLLFGSSLISVERYTSILQDFNNGISLYNRQELADIQAFIGAQSALSRLKERDEDMAAFLQHLDGKINMLLTKVDGRPTILDELQLQTLCVSGTGLAFWSEKQHAQRDIVELRLVLQPEHTFIDCFGSVIDCVEAIGEDGALQFRVSVQFLLIMDDDREALIQYNFRQQSLALKRRRIKNEDRKN